jgi:S-methyl-5-thioribose-1-phosphate isomerase
MIVDQKYYKTVWYAPENNTVHMIDQSVLPFRFEVVTFHNYKETAEAIRTMIVRGAGAIGATAGFAMAQAFVTCKTPVEREQARQTICQTRPTAVNLFYAVDRVFQAGQKSVTSAVEEAQCVAREDEDNGRKIGVFGNELIVDKCRILTHCNAGWLAFVDYGSALAPVYEAHRRGKRPFVYVDETRPRGQGARLTAWELHQNEVDHRVIADNAAAYYMQRGAIDMVITGADRIAANGDVANKIGTLEKAILADYYEIPFYVAAPSSTFDMACPSGDKIPIEERSEDELLYHTGLNESGEMVEIRMAAPHVKGLNPAFDVTPARLIKGFITERGIFTPEDIEHYLS